MHGRVADWRGDHTARNAGRLTLNPIPHIDPFGTILLPIALMLVGRGTVPIFGYAKPVPVNPYFMKKRSDMILVSLAGPLTNFVVALVIALIGLVLRLVGVKSLEVFTLFYYASSINIWLGIFNLIPIPPLDGSHILEYFLSNESRVYYERIAPFGFVIVFLFFMFAGRALSNLLQPVLNIPLRIMGV
jgi:Zn-dependent protease